MISRFWKSKPKDSPSEGFKEGPSTYDVGTTTATKLLDKTLAGGATAERRELFQPEVEALDVAPPPPPQGFAVYQHFYPLPMVTGDMVLVTGDVPAPSSALLDRLIASYRSEMEQAQRASGVWTTITGHKQDVHETLLAGDKDKLAKLLTDPAQSMLLHGFDQPTANSIKNLHTPGMLILHRGLILGSLRRLAEGIGALPMAYPEGYGQTGDIVSNDAVDSDDIIKAIEAEIGQTLTFPNPFQNEIGVDTKRGVLTYRSVQSLFQGWRLAALANGAAEKDKSLSALEIGGGTGRTAYFSYMSGVHDYTIVDLPLTGIVQSYFLASALGEDRVVMAGEPFREDAVKIISPPALKERPFTVVASFDALVEFSREAAADYLDYAVRNADVFCSINRESKPYRVRDLLQERNLVSTRTPYWLRNGYAEEVAILKPTK